MSSPYSYNSLGRPGKGGASGRMGSQSQLAGSGSQQNLSGTLNRTQVERRGATFQPARGRIDSNDSYISNDGNASLRRAAKSTERLNSTSSSISGSRSNLAQQRNRGPPNPNINDPRVDPGRQQPPPQQQQPPPPNPNIIDPRVDPGRQQPPPQQQQPPPPNPNIIDPRVDPGRQQPPSQQQQPPPPQQYDNRGPPPNQNNYTNIQNYSNINNNQQQQSQQERDVFYNRSNSNRSNVDNDSNAGSVSSGSSKASTVDNKFHEFEKVRVEVLRRGGLYDDNMFQASDSTIYYSRNPPYQFEWIRAKDIAAMYRYPPKFVSQGFSRFDIRQGMLGDCWFVAAMACLSGPDHRQLIQRVIPPGQSFQEGWYAGVFRFSFWHFGQWIQIVVDDLLPTVRGQLAFVSSTQPNEFWAPLMEKAYAKLYGSYEALKSGVLADSLTDLTGGITEEYTLHGQDADVPDNIVNILFKSLERMSLIGCAISDKGQGESVMSNGLVAGHAYSVTDLRRILTGQTPVNLIRIRNPHGDGKEWKGRWSEWSPDWQQISPADRERLGLVQRDDGEFWMEFEDFCENFDTLTICNLSPDSPIDMQRKWHVVEHNGRWIKGYNAGGRPANQDTYYTNPQYVLRLEDVDDDEDDTCSIIVQLMQKDRRKIKQKGEKFMHIGFQIYPLEKGYSVPLKKDFFSYHERVSSSGAYTNSRQVGKRLTLQPGDYVLVPTTWDADEEADYFVRFFFEKGNVAEYCDEKPEAAPATYPSSSPEHKEEENNFKNFFYRISGEDMEISAFELQEAINEGLKKDPNHTNISLDACRAFVNLMDVDGSGRLGFNEFQYLWSYLRIWKKFFYQYDTNNSGTLDSRELRSVVNAAGYKVPHKTLISLVFRFADERNQISMDSFLALMARLMKTFNTFHNSQKDGVAAFSLEQWLDKCLTL